MLLTVNNLLIMLSVYMIMIYYKLPIGVYISIIAECFAYKVLEALLEELLVPRHQFGVVIDGFPRSKVLHPI